MNSDIIILDVSGRKFRTRKDTLATSDYFKGLVSRWGDSTDRQEDGSYFIDADPEVFEHLLNFMRRPSRFPLYWAKEKGFDFVLYNKLEAEADFFLLHDLRDWIHQKRYLHAIKIAFKIVTHNLSPGTSSNHFAQGDTVIETYLEPLGALGEDGPYLCPRGRHNGYPYHCDTECGEARRNDGSQHPVPTKYLISVSQAVEFDASVCVNN